MNRYIESFSDVWKSSLKKNNFIKEFSISVLSLGVLLFFFTRFLMFIENRPGVILSDPVLSLFNPVDLTWLIFTLIYASLLFSIFILLRSPIKILQAIQVYSLMIFVRIICMYLVPLEPPADHLPLADPFVEYFGTGDILTKDLFFSGHTATLLILFLIADKGLYKNFLFTAVLLVGSFVIIQHVHYTIDVIIAVFVTYCCFSVIRYHDKHKYENTP